MRRLSVRLVVISLPSSFKELQWETEVYLQIIQGALDKGKTAILLVPENFSDSSNDGAFYCSFGDKVAILHSGLSNGEKYDEWRKVERGDAQVVVGARSAIFAPLKNLGS